MEHIVCFEDKGHEGRVQCAMAMAQGDQVEQAHAATGGVWQPALDEVLHTLPALNHRKTDLRVVFIKGHSGQELPVNHVTGAPPSTCEFALRFPRCSAIFWSSMNDEVHDQKVDAVGSQSHLIDTDIPCRSAGTCIHKPENKQLQTRLREVTRKGRRQGRCLYNRLLDADFVLVFVGRLRGQVNEVRPHALVDTEQGTQAIWFHLAFLLRSYGGQRPFTRMTGPLINATHKLVATSKAYLVDRAFRRLDPVLRWECCCFTLIQSDESKSNGLM